MLKEQLAGPSPILPPRPPGTGCSCAWVGRERGLPVKEGSGQSMLGV